MILRALLAAGLLYLAVGPALAQPFRYPAYGDGVTWLIDETGTRVGRNTYEAARSSTQGPTAVRTQGRWGYVEAGGDWAIEARFMEAYPFRDGWARVRDESGWHLIDLTGATLTTRPYADIRQLAGDYASVQVGSAGLTGTESEGKWGIVDRSGRVVAPATLEGLLSVSEGRAPAQDFRRFLMFRLERRWGYVDTAGNWVVDADYTSARPASSGLALVADRGEGRFLDASGAVVLEPPYPNMFPFSEDRARVGDGSAWGFIDREGAQSVPLIYEAARDFSEGRAAIRSGGKWGYIDAAGQVVITPQFSRAGDFDGPLARVQIDGRNSYIDREGRLIWSD